jgi:hypothetical protein
MNYRSRKANRSKRIRNRNKRRSRRGGAYKIVFYRTSNTPDVVNTIRVPDSQFNVKFLNPDGLKTTLITAVNNYKEDEPEDDTVLEEDVEIHLIRGTVDTIVFQGKMADWSVDQTFIDGLQEGDKIFIQLI